MDDKVVRIKRDNERVIYISDHEIATKSPFYRTHRDYIAHKFKEIGFEVIKWEHTYNDDGSHREEGLVYRRTDSEIDPRVEVVGVIGQSIRQIGASE